MWSWLHQERAHRLHRHDFCPIGHLDFCQCAAARTSMVASLDHGGRFGCLAILSSITYGGVNWNGASQGDAASILAIICYPLMLAGLCGCFRNMTKYFKFGQMTWNLLKIECMFAVLYYLIVGMVTVYQPVPEGVAENFKDVYLLFLFTVLAFLAEFINKMQDVQKDDMDIHSMPWLLPNRETR
eukprot:TRINITY_DN5849_c0_g1_i1.p1 TRINITY_DN5849_c0_g1~~TRINITY_DN5849_c0_g1_i1.p1  ORF type:complete len:184 (-),score=33.99 TRINITY_DN5849_c0_g1_i1:86-637(-)